MTTDPIRDGDDAHRVDDTLDTRSIDEDPTGMRALLRSLPDPGPMPEDLVARIKASLEHEGATVTSLDEHRARRTLRSLRSPKDLLSPRFLPWAAAAGLVVVAGGGLLATGGGNALLEAAGGGAAHSTLAGRSSASLSAPGTAADAAAPGQDGSDRTQVVMSNASWTDTDVVAAARVALAAPPITPLAAEAPSLGPIGTPTGARDCATALGIPAGDAVVVDLGTYAGSPAALVVATAAEGKRTAYLVARSCRLGEPSLRSGPHAV